MTSGTVTKTSLFSQAWENIYNLVDTRTVVADPTDPANLKSRKFVYRRHPHSGARDATKNFTPYLVVHSPRIRMGQKSADGTLKDVTWEASVEVRASGSDRRGGRNTTTTDKVRGAFDFDSICDDLLELNRQSNQNTLRNYRMHFPTASLVDSGFITENGEDIFSADFDISWREFISLT